MENNINKSQFVFGLILGLSLIISATIGALTFYKLRSMDYISATGSAKKAVVSDKVKWSSSISRAVKASSIKDGYQKMDNDLKAVKNFLTTNGVPAEAVEVSPIFMNEIYEQNPGPEKSYNLQQNITVQSAEVEKIGNLAKTTGTLASQGIIYSTMSLEYYYSKLPEVRVELLDSAIGDAKARAQKIAQAGGKRIGALKSASSGVVQVMSPNSVEVSDYGMYDTSSINKEIMITVKGTFELK